MLLKVLVVDDSVIIAAHLKCLISRISEIEIGAHAHTLAEAQEMFLNYLPEIIILELFINEESSIDFLSFLNTHYPSTIVIILTNNTDTFYKSKCKSLGVEWFLDKSYQFEKVKDSLIKIKEKIKEKII